MPISIGGLQNWVFPDDPSILAVRTADGRSEWAPAGSQNYARAEMTTRLNAVLNSIRIEIDVVAETLKVWADADAMLASTGPSGALETTAGWSRSGSAPIFEASFEELDDIYSAGCGAGCLLGYVGLPCSLPAPCRPLGNIAALLDAIAAAQGVSISTARLTFNRFQANWVESPDPTHPGPALDIGVHADVSFGVSGEVDVGGVDWDINNLADIEWSGLDAHFLSVFESGAYHCPAGPCAEQAAPSSASWEGFVETPGEPTSEWTNKNLSMVRLDAQDFDGFHMSWNFGASVSDGAATLLSILLGPLAGLIISMRNDDLAEMQGQVRDQVLLFLDGAAQLFQMYVNFLPRETDPRRELNMLEHHVDDVFGFDCLRYGCSGICVLRGPDGTCGATVPVPADLMAARFLEGSAGASRQWWNMLAGPLVSLDRSTFARFEYTGATLGSLPDGRPTPRFWFESDLDCDGAADAADGCPTLCVSSGGDLDGDYLGDACDLCPNLRRTDTVPPRWSSHYNQSPGDGIAVPGDRDGDDLADSCDLCPSMKYPGYAPGLPDPSSCTASGGSSGMCADDMNNFFWMAHHPQDADADRVGARCDNCEAVANSDQWNCNARDELADGVLADPPTPVAKGLGDACDPTPCVDSCRGTDATHNEPELALPRGDYWGMGDREPITASVCPVGSDLTAAPMVNLRTRARGCSCDPSQYSLAVRGIDTTCFDLTCPPDGEASGSWADVTDDDPVHDYVTYPYRPLYYGDPGLGRAATPFTQSGRASYWRPAGTDAATDRVTEQTWYWIDQLCGGMTDDCTQQVQMWFKPEEVPAWMTDPFVDDHGNTYTAWYFTNADVMITLPPDEFRPPFGGGEGLPGPLDIEDLGGISPNTWSLADIIDLPCWAAMCPDWLEGLLFEVSGDQVAGLTVTSWTKDGNNLGWVLGSKLATTELFDLKRASIAFAYDQNGDPTRYWTFGGVGAGGEFSEQMWTGRLAVIDEAGAVKYVGNEGLAVPLSKGAQPDPASVFYELAPVRRTGAWPDARAGAALACTGVATTGGTPGGIGGCENVCPKSEVALGLKPPPDGVREAAGKLILVGGEGATGPLSDIWIYDETATAIKPAGAISSSTGPWPSGWRQVGYLPPASGGLTKSGSVQVGRNLWLAGGRNVSGPVADVYRVSLDTGAAELVPAVAASMPVRSSPAVTYDARTNSLLVFGGLDAANRPLTDLWAFEIGTGRWSQAAAACSGTGCPVVTGKETLVVDPHTGQVTVIASRGVGTNGEYGWVLEGGAWRSKSEQAQEESGADCDGDTAPDALFGARCGAGDDGFPSYGRLRCDAGELACRTPVAPGTSVWEYAMPGLRAVAPHEAGIVALHDRTVDSYVFDADGRLEWLQSINLARAGRDVATTWEAALVADGEGVSIYGFADGLPLSTVPTCGQARRVFVDGPLAYVVGLRSILVVDVTDPAAPVVLQTVGIVPGRHATSVTWGHECSGFDAGMDRLCDATGACGAFGRMAAAYDDDRVYLNILGLLDVIDFRNGVAPVLAGSVPIGFAKDMVAEGGLVYADGPGRRSSVVAELPDGTWVAAGGHDVPAWVEGVVDVAPWSVRWDGNRLEIARKQ
ncbi:MAG: hypothetical protein HY905_17925 [Deltaproteobacteria bacterium]|nr:hypothetical protein [Deltaproteobacteria bacterium]